MKEIDLPAEVINWYTGALSANSFAVTGTTSLRVEASHRSFYRLHTGSASVILMVSPPTLEKNDNFLFFAELFKQQQLPVPRQLAADPTNGWFLMTDLGHVDLGEAYGTARQDEALSSALDSVQSLARVSHADIQPYSQARMETELHIFNEWFLQNLLGVEPGYEEYRSSHDQLVAAMLSQPFGCTHRDYHCRNLLFDGKNLGIVDFQDALRGPRLYDPASLLRDCYHEFSEATVDQWLDYFLLSATDFAGIDRSIVKQWFDFTAIQRQMKAVGIFSRLHLRDAKSSHLPHILPVLRRLLRLSETYPMLARLNVQLKNCIKSAEPQLLDLAG